MTLSMAAKLAAVVLLAPLFLLPALDLALLCLWIGNIYMKAQLSVKREMSNAKSPVIEVLGSAIAGLSKSTQRTACILALILIPLHSASIRAYSAQSAFKAKMLYRVDRYVRVARTLYNVNRYGCSCYFQVM